MAIYNSSLGIDFRPNHLILTLLKKSVGKIRLVDYQVYPLGPDGQKETLPAQGINLITAFIARHQIDKGKVSICIPRGKVVVRFIRLPLNTRENLRRVLEYEAPRYTPFDKEDFYFDYQILGEDKEGLRLIAVFVKKEEITAYLSLLKKLGIQPVSIQIPSAAALNLFFYNEGREKGNLSILLDLSGNFGEMNLLQGKEWKESFHLPLPEEGKEVRIVDALKHSGVNGEALIRADFFIYGLDAVERPPLLWGSSIPARKISFPPLTRIKIGESGPRPDALYSSIGVPLQGLTKTAVELNLLPPEMRKKVRQIAKPLFMILGLLALVLSITWGMGIYSRYQKELETLRTEVQKKKPEVEAVEKLQKKRGDLLKEISELEKIKSAKFSMIDILQEVTRTLPASVWVWNFKCSGREVEISGFADSASDLIPLLDRSPLFERVEFLAPVTKERERRGGGEKERERFKIRMRLESRRTES